MKDLRNICRLKQRIDDTIVKDIKNLYTQKKEMK